jgi:predicted kinase
VSKDLIILRGVPGAGKSTVGELFQVGVTSTDDYFYDEDGVYKFDQEKLSEAHQWCQDRIEDQMVRCVEKIVVANTFTREWEMQPYFDMAKKHGYRVHSLVVERRHEGPNLHDVPAATIGRMKARFTIKL